MYAGRRRRKPRATRPGPAEGGGSKPSKRHRERLKRELERLAGLLPFALDVLAGLDKLSVLRLSAGFLRARSFLGVALKNPGAKEAQRDRDCGTRSAPGSAAVPEGDLLLQALDDFVLVVRSEGLIFYPSHTIQDYLGFHQPCSGCSLPSSASGVPQEQPVQGGSLAWPCQPRAEVLPDPPHTSRGDFCL